MPPEKNRISSSITEMPKNTLDKHTDVVLRFLEVNKHLVAPLTAPEEARLKKKLYLWVVLLAVLIELMLYVRVVSPFYARMQP